MKIGTSYNRVETQVFHFSTHDLIEALKIVAKRHLMRLPSNARDEFEVDFGDCHDEAVILTRRLIYDPQPLEPLESSTAVGAVDPVGEKVTG